MSDAHATTSVRYEPGCAKLFVFDEVYQARAAQEQAEKKKLGAFGLLAKFNPFQRPQSDTVALAEHELRYEPFWHVVARREVDYVRTVAYAVPIPNAHARRVTLGECTFDVVLSGGRGRVDIPVEEHCHRKTDVDVFRTGHGREAARTPPAALRSYVDRYRATEADEMHRPSTATLHVTRTMVEQEVRASLATEAVDAHQVTADEIVFEKLYLYYRPVYAFKYHWAERGVDGVVEIDGLTGEAVENGEWLRDKVDRVLTREALFEVSADLAGLVVPGAGIPIKLIDRAMRPPA